MKLKKPTISSDKRLKDVFLPTDMSTNLAELIGIQFGDGCLHKNNRGNYCISYCLNIKEKELKARVVKLFKQIFSVKLNENINLKKNAINLRTHSKLISYFIHENFWAPFGKKRTLRIPPIISSNKNYLKSFLKGLHSTDGYIFIKKDKGYEYPIIKICTISKIFAKDIQNALFSLGFRTKLNKKGKKDNSGFDVVLHGNVQLKLWEKVMKSGSTGI